MIKHVRKHKKDQTVTVMLLIYCEGDDLATSVIYHITEDDWDTVNWSPKTLGELRRWYNQQALKRGIEYLGYKVMDMEALWDQGDIILFHFDRVQYNGI